MKRIAFTLVLNGMPYIRQQAEILPKLFDEWHIIEGATRPRADTSWCKDIDQKYYNTTKDNFGRSVDGTAEFLDELAEEHDNVFIHLKLGDLWDSKTEMCNQIAYQMENCILMQFDVDEIWTEDKLNEVLKYAEEEQGFHGMLFKCNYFVGEGLVIQNEDCYGNNPGEWCRLWKIGPKTSWRSHEPPRIHGLTDFLSRDFTKNKGWIFDHYAYYLESQVAFKENFYGYTGAVESWKRLQNNKEFPCLLRNYLPWVTDNAIVGKQ